MQSNIKRYIRDLPNYEGGDWTINEAINKEFTPNIKRFQIDAYQVLQSRYKDAERIRNTAKAATDIYEDLVYISTHGTDPTAFANIIEKAKRWAIYGFITSRDIDREARDMVIKALKLPSTLKHLEANQEENKRMAFSPESVKEIAQARFKTVLLQRAVNNRFTNYR